MDPQWSTSQTAVNCVQIQWAAVRFRPLSQKSVDPYYKKCCKQKTLHLDDLIRTIEGLKNQNIVICDLSVYQCDTSAAELELIVFILIMHKLTSLIILHAVTYYANLRAVLS